MDKRGSGYTKQVQKKAGRDISNSKAKAVSFDLVGEYYRNVEADTAATLLGCQRVDRLPASALIFNTTLPSAGSAGHVDGSCRPCAHSWRKAGCSKGSSCTFCHICGEEEVKQKKKEKMERQREERRQEKMEKTAAARRLAAASVEACKSKPLLFSAGEFSVNYSWDEERIEVAWQIDLRRLRHQNRCGILRRFPLLIRGNEVPFLMTIAPARGMASFPAHQSAPIVAALLLKCVDMQCFPAGCPLGITTLVGTQALRSVSNAAHDFSVESTKVLSSSLDLASEPSREGPAYVVKLIFSTKVGDL